MAGYWKCSNTNANLFGNRLGILRQILIAMDCFFYLYISDKHINLGNQFHDKKYNERDRNISKTLFFIFHRSI